MQIPLLLANLLLSLICFSINKINEPSLKH